MTDKEKLRELINQKGKSITIVIGLSKNAGKTTLLNWLLRNCHTENVGILTTGRDGEDYDSIHTDKKHPCKTHEPLPKPKIQVQKGSLFTTWNDVIRNNSSMLTVLGKLPFKAAGKPLWIVRAEFPVNIEIVGPSSVADQIFIAEELMSLNAQKVFIDGSLDRKAISNASQVDNIIVVVSPQTGNLNEILTGLTHLKHLSQIPDLEGMHHDKFKLNKNLPQNNIEKIKNIILEEKSFTKERVIFFCKIDSHYQELEPVFLPFNSLLGNEKLLLSEISNTIGRVNYLYLPKSLTEKSFSFIKHAILKENIDIIVEHPFFLMLSESSLKRILPRLITVRSMNIVAIAVNSFSVDGNHIDCDEMRQVVRNSFPVPVVDVMEA